MSGFLLLTITAQWHTMIVDAGRDHSTPVIFADSNGYPVIAVGVGGGGNDRSEFRWTGDKWLERPIPYNFDKANIRLDRNGYLHIMNAGYGYLIDYHQTDTGWWAWVSPPCWAACMTLDSFNLPHFVGGSVHCWLRPDSTWVTDTLQVYLGGILMMAVTDPLDNIHVMAYTETTVKYGLWSDSSWICETVYDAGDSGDFLFSELWLYADPFGGPHLFFYPYMLDGYKFRYAWKDSLENWHTEAYYTLDGNPLSSRSMVVDSLGIRHTVTLDSTGIYHVIRYPWEKAWHVRERIDTCSSASRRAMAIDRFGYLHLVFTDGSDYTLYYATTNPDIGVYEFPPEPKPGLTLLMAPGGFWITGYSGPVQIYDPAGRLVLSKEIKGKTLISPLRPEVYFVMAGKEKARVAVR